MRRLSIMILSRPKPSITDFAAASYAAVQDNVFGGTASVRVSGRFAAGLLIIGLAEFLGEHVEKRLVRALRDAAEFALIGLP